jgi:histidine triad (HIT) family protein
MNCLFCSIAEGETPAALVFESEGAVAFLDIHPKAPGHTMVIPRAHRENILELTDAEVPFVFTAVREVTGTLRHALRPDGFTIGINHGRKAGQAIDHLHVHILPRFGGDGGGSLHTIVENTPQESVEEMEKKIKSIPPWR